MLPHSPLRVRLDIIITLLIQHGITRLMSTMPCTVQGLLSGNSSVDCEYILLPGQKPRQQKVDNMEFRECGEPCSLVKIPRDCQASGCYCKNNFVLNITTGLCSRNRCPEVFEPIPLNLSEYTHMYTQCMNLRAPVQHTVACQ